MTGDHGHGQQRGHTHAHGAAAARSGARHKSSLLIAFVLSLTVLVLEAVAGFLTNSLALLSDAGHMLTDVIGLGMALAAIQLADRHARSVRTTPSQHTFGLYRLEILAALVNAVLLFGVAIFVLIEAVDRLRDEPEVHGWPMLIVADHRPGGQPRVVLRCCARGPRSRSTSRVRTSRCSAMPSARSA